MQSRVKETVSYTWTIEDFANQSGEIESPEFVSTNESKFSFYLHTNMEPANQFLFIEFWYDFSLAVASHFNYRVSILGESAEKLYSKEYHWRYDSMSLYNIVNFICKREISKFLINGNLTLLLEVDILDDPNEHQSIIDRNKVSIQADLTKDYQSLLESGDFIDVAFVVGGKEFALHKNILATRSAVFKAMLSGDFEEKKQNRVEIVDVDVDVFEHLLAYIYSGKLADLAQFGLDLFVAADKYHLDQLKCICEQFLLSSLTIESVCNVLVIADMHSSDTLKANCIDFITIDNSAQVMTTDGWKLVKSKPDLVLAILENMSAKTKHT